jgi:hypothetical protein
MTDPAPRRTTLLIAAALVAPLAAALLYPIVPATGTLPEPAFGGSSFASPPHAWARATLGAEPQAHPWITNVQIVDFDRDGLPDVIACDALRNRVVWIRQAPRGHWEERVLADDLPVPAHATVVDLDGDGDLDIVVAILGDIWPNDEVIGSVVWLEHVGDRFVRRVILDQVRRVADVQPGDFDGDGDLDLAVAVFGYARGQVLWLQNRGGGRFRPHELLSAPGAIHVPVADYDGDGDPDIAAIVSQDDEELWAFENAGEGEFAPRRLWFSVNFDLGSAGLVVTDLDGDGDADLLLPVGDNFEDKYAYPQPYHGCFWFENRGAWDFVPRRIASFGGTYAADAGDLDGDGDQDVVLVSMTHAWDRPGRPSIVWLENDGRQNFTTWAIDDRPTHLATVAVGDLDGDGRADIVAGGLHLHGPFDRLGRVTAWIGRGGPRP